MKSNKIIKYMDT